MSGFTCPPLAIALVAAIPALLIWSAWPTLRRIRPRMPFVIVGQDFEVRQASSRPQKITDPERLAQARAKLDEFINLGERFIGEMQGRGFNLAQLECEVRVWEDSMAHDLWEGGHQYAAYIMADQGNFTPTERFQYIGWNTMEASVRIRVERKLKRLRELRSQL